MEQPRTPKPPKELAGKSIAIRHWYDVYPILAHRLQPSDIPAFTTMCLMWHWVHSTDPLTKDPKSKEGVVHFAAAKLYKDYSKQFGLTPDARRKVDPPKAETLNDVLGGLFAPMEKRG